MLLSAGADPNIPDARGWTPLHYVGLYRREADMAARMVGHGADMHIRGPDAITPMDTMDSENRLVMMWQWFTMRHFRYPLEAAVLQGADAVKTQLTYRPDRAHLNSALLLVQNEGTLDLLLKAGADPKARDPFGRTPLFFVNNSDIVGPLVAAGVDINARDHLGRTALHTACSGCKYELLKHGADPWIKDKFGRNGLETMYNWTMGDIFGYIRKLPAKGRRTIVLNADFPPRFKCKLTLKVHHLPGRGKGDGGIIYTAPPRYEDPCTGRGMILGPLLEPKPVTPFVEQLIRQGEVNTLNRLAKYGARFDTMPGVLEMAKKRLPSALPIFEKAAGLWKRRLCRHLSWEWYEDDYESSWRIACTKLDAHLNSFPGFPNDSVRLVFAMLNSRDNGLATRIINAGLAFPLCAPTPENSARGDTLLFEAAGMLAVTPVLAMLRVLEAHGLGPYVMSPVSNSKVNVLDVLVGTLKRLVEDPQRNRKGINRAKKLIKAVQHLADKTGCPVTWSHDYEMKSGSFAGISIEVLQELADAGFNLSARDIYGHTLLFMPLSGPVIRWLIRHGVDPNQPDNDGRTPLFHHYKIERLEALLAMGADPTLKSETADDAVLSHGKYYSAVVLARAQAKWTNNWGAGSPNALFDARTAWDVEQAVKAGALLDLAGAHGITPLHLAVYKKAKDVVTALIDHGVKLDPKLADNA